MSSVVREPANFLCIETFERNFAGNKKGIEKDFMIDQKKYRPPPTPRDRSWGRYENGLLDLASLVQAP